MPLAPGARLGPYEILGTAGAGGMGEVYRAHDTRLERTVAIKVLPAEIQRDPQRRDGLRREARAIAALNHPRICALHDVGSDGELDFLVMEYVEGETLEQRLKRGPLAVAEVLQIGAEIADGLAAAHAAGIVHRDLKPANVMLTRGGVKLLDFGIAKRQPVALSGDAPTQEAPTATAPGIVAGSLPYMAPEQAEGRGGDARTDLFAFGAVLYEMITGRRAFLGTSSASIVAAILASPPPAPSSLRDGTPRSLDRVVGACLTREPGERWQSALDVARELRWIAADLEGDEVLPSTSSKRSAWRLHATWAAALIVFGMLAWPFRVSAPRGAVPPPNPRPVILLMDSPLPGRVYDPRTLAAGGTNADDLTDALRELPVAIVKETTSAMWHREELVLRQNPDLIVSHLSCLLDQRVGEGQQPVQEHLFELAGNRLVLFFGYVAAVNPRTQFVVYSRGAFNDPVVAEQWKGEAAARLPVLRGRLHTFKVPGGHEHATFRDPETARLIRERVAAALGLR